MYRNVQDSTKTRQIHIKLHRLKSRLFLFHLLQDKTLIIVVFMASNDPAIQTKVPLVLSCLYSCSPSWPLEVSVGLESRLRLGSKLETLSSISF